MSAPRPKSDLFVGRYHVMRELGRGGMGTVELAYQVDMEREVALKRLLPRNVGLPAAEGWFKREYKALAAIRHPGVPAVYDCGRTDDLLAYFTMERIDGPSLADALKTRRFEPAEALSIAIDLGRILAAAHAAGVVHRDVKPANIILEAGGRVRLIDFGICFFLPSFHARQNLRSVGESGFETGPLEIAGSQGYTDPALMFGGSAPSPQSDIFSLCTVLYEMLTGRRLHDDKLLAFRTIDSGEVAPELASAVIELRRGSQPSPRDRHTSMDELIRGLEIARSSVLRVRSRPAKNTPRALFLGLSLANLAILITLAVAWTGAREEASTAVALAPTLEPPAAAEPPGAVREPLAAVGPPVADDVPAAAVTPPARRKQPMVADTRLLSQALVSEAAAGRREELRACLNSGDATLEITAEAGQARLLRVEWEAYDPANPSHRCFARALKTLALPRRGPSGPYRLTVGK